MELRSSDIFRLLLCVMMLSIVKAETFTIVAVIDDDMVDQTVPYLENSLKTLESSPHHIQMKYIYSSGAEIFHILDQVCQFENISLLLDLSQRTVSESLRELSTSLGITHVISNDPYFLPVPRDQFMNVSVHIQPPFYSMMEVIRSIVIRDSLSSVAIIYDETFPLENRTKLFLSNLASYHLYKKMEVSSPEAILTQLRTLAIVENIFLACSAENAAAYLAQVQTADMAGFDYNWFVLTQDMIVECPMCQDSLEITVLTAAPVPDLVSEYMTLMNVTDENQLQVTQVFFHDLVIRLSSALFDKFDHGEFQEPTVDCYRENFTAESRLLSQARELRDEIEQFEYEGVFGGYHFQDHDGYLKTEISISPYYIENGQVERHEPVGNWSHGEDISGFTTGVKTMASYRVITIKDPPFVFVSDTLPGDVFPGEYFYSDGMYYYGYCISMILKISEIMNFNFTIMEPPDGAYGSMKDDGSWDGMVKEVLEDRADIIVAPFSVMAERENVIDFTIPYYDLVGITILIKKPKFEYSVFKFMTVLEEAVWGCVFSAFIIVSTLLAVFDKLSPYSYQNQKHTWNGEGDEPRIFTLKEGLWFCMTSLTPQGGGEAPRALSGRLVAATWWMFGFIMIATYTANLAAFLTVSRLEQPVESLDDLANQFKTKYAPQKSTATETYFKRMKDIEDKFYEIWKSMSLNDSLGDVERAKLAVWDYPVSDKFTNMWTAMTESGFPDNFTAAIERIKNPPDGNQFAFMGDATQNKYATLTDCELWQVGEEFSRKPYALAVKEGSPIKDQLSSVILMLLNERTLEDLKARWWDYNRAFCPVIEDESDGISLKNIGGVFLVIFIGIGLGLITLGFEYYWYRWRPDSSRLQNNHAIQNGNGGQMNGGFDG